jgi:hypothetical protein
LIFWIVTALSIPLAMLVGSWVAEGRIRELSVLIGLPVLGVLIIGISQWLWPFAVGSIFLQGAMPFIPAAFKPFELFLIILLVRFVIEDVVFRKRWIKLGPRPDYLFILGLLGVLLVHGVQDRFAMRVIGSDIWGGRAYFTLLLAFATYFVLQSSRLDLRVFRSLPLIALAFGAAEFMVQAITFAVPAWSLPVSSFYSSVAPASGETFARRLGFAGNFGYLLIFWSLSDCRLQDFLNKGRFLKAIAFGAGILFCLLSGFRSSLIVAAIIIAVASIRDFGRASVFMLLPLFLAIAGVIGLHLAGVQLPATVQRGLTMIPGIEWDEDAVADAEGSLDFRSKVREIWLRQYFPENMLVGRGFGLHPDDMMATMPYLTDEIGGYAASILALSKYNRDEAFVVSGNLHHGFFSTIDRFGLAGMLCFVLWTFVALRRMFAELVSSRVSPMNPALQWLALYVISFTIAFPLGALKIETFLPQHLFLCGLFAALYSATYYSKTYTNVRGDVSSFSSTSDRSLSISENK